MREDFYSEYFRIEDRHWWFVGRRRIVLAVVASRLATRRHASATRILDFGCGTGTMLAHLRRFGYVEGIDADERAVGFCRARGEERVHLLPSGALPYPDDSFDLITALDVLEHIEDDCGTLRELARVLRPGGTFLATVPAHRWMWGAQDDVSHHFRRYTSRELAERMRAAELDVERLTYFNAILFAPIAAVRLARRLRPPKGEPRSDFEMTQGQAANRVLAGLFSCEARWLNRRDLPLGVSLLVLGTARS